MKKIGFLLSLLIINVGISRTIDVSEHGVIPEQDATLPMLQLLDSVREEGDITLKFPQGDYLFYPENAFEEYREVSNHDNSLKRIAFPLHQFKNLTIDGSNSTFIFHGRMIPFVLEASENVELKNFNIDWNRSFHDELKVVENDKTTNSFVVEVDMEKFPVKVEKERLVSIRYDWEDQIGQNILWDPKTRAPIHSTKQYGLNYNRHKATQISENRFRIEAPMKTLPPVGSVLITYGAHTSNRKANAFHIANSKDIKLEDIRVLAAGGMGLMVERTENIHLNRFNITSSPTRLISTRADATHFIGCKGLIVVENCLLEHMLDDAINVHGAYVKVEEVFEETNQLLCEISHFQQTGLLFGEAGDKVALLSRTTVLPFHDTTIKSIKVLNEDRFLVTLDSLPEELPEGPLSLENITWNPDLIFRNNIVRENRARSILVTTKGKVLIENNYLSSQMNGILVEGDNKFWYESGAVEDVTIRNNTFVNSGFGAEPFYPLYASPMLTPEQHMGEGQYHRNIRFVDNTLKSFDGRMVFARSVQGLEIKGNKMEFSTDYPADNSMPVIDLIYCDNVTIKENTATGFANDLKIREHEDSSNVATKNNQGIVASE